MNNENSHNIIALLTGQQPGKKYDQGNVHSKILFLDI